jgi:hypothetical protein
MPTAAEIIARDLRARQAEIDARRRDLASPPASIEALSLVRDDYSPLYDAAGAGSAPFPLDREQPASYRKRLLNGVLGLAPSHRGIDVYAVPEAALGPIEREIRAEAARTIADKTVGDLDRGGTGLRRVDSVDESGRTITEWHRPVWFGASMMPPAQYVRRINTGHPPVVRWAGSRAGRRG